MKALSAIGVIAAAAVSVRMLPALELLLPPCPFHRLTGWDCPGCGMTRAFQAMFAGDFGMAFRLNAFAPVIAVYTIVRLMSAAYRNSWGPLRISPGAANVFLTTAAMYGIVRNILPGVR